MGRIFRLNDKQVMNPLGILNARFGSVAEEDLDTLRTGGSVLVQMNGPGPGAEAEAEPHVHTWECGCFKIDRDFAMYVLAHRRQTTTASLYGYVSARTIVSTHDPMSRGA